MPKKLLLPLLLAAAIALVPPALHAQDLARLDPRLVLVRRLVLGGPVAPVAPGEAVRGLGRATLPSLPGLAPLALDAQGGVWLRTLARVAPGGEAGLLAAGARLGARAGDVVSALVPVDALDRVAAARGLVYLEAAAELKPTVEGFFEPEPSAVGAAPEREPGGSAGGPVSEPSEPPGSRSRSGSGSQAVSGRRVAHVPGRDGVARAAVAAAFNDAGVLDSDADALRQREGDVFYGLAGQGVVVGLYDTGLDLTHRDFLPNVPGLGRVRWAWDQTASGSGPGLVGSGTYGYGRECTRGDVMAGSCPMRDLSGHGTHIAGTAAGSGAATGKGMPAYRFTGMAPLADLLVVKGGDTSFSSDRLLDGVAWIFERARQLGEPAVVNLSLETQNGPHDGTSNFERALDALVGPGRILAVAAGNSGVNADESPAFVRTPIHAGGRLATAARDGFDIVVPQYVPAAGAANDGAILDLWYDGRDSIALVITSPNGRQVRVATGDTAAVPGPDGYVAIDNAHAGRNPNNGDREAVIAIVDQDATQTPAVGRWHVEVQGSAVAGSGRWDLWLVGSTLRNATQLTAFDGPTVRNATLVSSPGTATRAITVAAYAGRHEWQGPGGATQAYPFQEKLGDIAFFSDPGPRRDGVLKPEIAAPGKVVVSSMSRDASTWSALPTFVEADSVHAVLMGTSMATPFVAGAAALLLQLRPTLTPEALRALLTGSARRDAFTPHPYTGEGDAVPNAQWGYGKLDVAAAVHALAPPPGSLRLDVLPGPGQGLPISAAGTRLSLLRLSLRADSLEAQQVTQLGFDVLGRDTAATLLLVRDLNGDGVAAADEPVVSSLRLRLDTVTTRVTMAGPVIPAGMSRDYVLALQLGRGVPNGARFWLGYRPADLRAQGTLSGVSHTSAPPGTVGSGVRPTTVLNPGQALNLSQNPVRSAPLIINYAERPRAVLVYSLTGARVRSLSGAELEDGRAVWSLDNDRGRPVANGVYLLVVDAPSGRILRKLIVAR